MYTPDYRFGVHAVICADVDESSKTEIKTTLLQYDRTLLVSDPRRCEPKKYVSAAHLLPDVPVRIIYAVAHAEGDTYRSFAICVTCWFQPLFSRAVRNAGSSASTVL